MGALDLALAFMASYGLIAIFVLLVLDSALLLPVFPGEIFLIVAVATYGIDPASLVMLILLCTAAAMIGSLLLYGLMRVGGSRVIKRFPRLFMISEKRREKLEATFQTSAGQTAVLFLRFVPMTRILVNIPAGLAKMPIKRFIALSTIGMLGYHSAFLWFTYEVNRPGSVLESQADRLEEAYASPAWNFVLGNQIITGVMLLVIAIILATRAAAIMQKQPGQTPRSIIGFLTRNFLMWGGIALAIAVFIEPYLVYGLIAVGGIDLPMLALQFGYPREYLVWAVAGIMVVFGLVLRAMQKTAELRHKRHNLIQNMGRSKGELEK